MKAALRTIRTAVIAGLIGLIFIPNLYSQQGFTYQAVARDLSGEPLADQELTVRIAILADSPDGELIWQEEHNRMTSSMGLFTLLVGDPDALNQSGSAGSFDQIDWSAHTYFINAWIKTTGDFIDVGGSHIQPVPTAKYSTFAGSANTAETATSATSAENANSADYATDAGNASTANYATTAGSATTAETATTATTAESASSADYATDAGNASTANYATSAGSANSANTATSANSGVSNFIVQPEAALPLGEALFEVKGADGLPVFAVYEDMVWVYADPTATKGKKGGFAVGGYSNDKGVTEEYMRVTGDSVRVYIETDPLAKGVKGGFAVGGISRTTKGVTEEYMRVTGDSVRVYIETDPLAKGVKGGFAVGGISRTTKGEGDDYLTVEPAGTHVFFDEEVAAKGVKGGFAVGGYSNTKSASNQLMSLTPKNYFIGHEAGLNIGLDGLYNQFIGYQAGRLTSSADYNVFLGYQAGMNNTTGGSNILLGYRAGLNFNGTDNVVIGTSALQNGQMYNSVVIGKEAALNAQGDGWGNVMVGYRSGYNNKVSGGSGIYGARNVFLGRQAGEANDQGGNNVYVGAFAGNDNVNGLRNVCVGDDAGGVGNAGSNNVYTGERAGYTNRGNGNIVIGREAGSAETNYTLDSNYDNNVMIGYRSGFVNKTGDGNVFIGGYSGYNETGANKLYIANTTSKTLIWGDFTNDYVRINDHVGIGTSPHSNYGLLVDGPDAYYSLVVYKGAYAYGTGFVDGSDRNLKKNILTLENTLDKVMNLRGVTYRWDTDNPDAGTSDESTQIGVIAQEVEAVFPELVTENPDGYKGVSYGKLSAVLIEAIKEQQSMIDQQQKVIEELQTRLDILEKK